MKKIILAVVLILFSTQSYAQLSDAYQSGKQKVKSFVSEKTAPDTDPLSDKNGRKSWELELGVNFMYSPTNGKPQFTLESWSAELVHNLSYALGAYVRYDDIKFEKKKYGGAEFAGKWSGKAGAAGFQFYVFPEFRIYGGIGTAELTAENGGKSDYGSFVDWGAKIDIPLKDLGYKIVFAYKVVGVDSKDDEDQTDVLGDWSYNAVSLTIAFPF